MSQFIQYVAISDTSQSTPSISVGSRHEGGTEFTYKYCSPIAAEQSRKFCKSYNDQVEPIFCCSISYYNMVSLWSKVKYIE